ncbi:MAG: hypothetical protein GY862_18725 [Gammaproteobacteria bacterium]|nr:hypothetical protein [Gammaproteobacteria bacterium]
MTKEDIKDSLKQLNAELERINVKGEICLYGGAVMCLLYNARPSTKDVEAVFEPSRKLWEAAGKAAEKKQISDEWLNDSVKGFVVSA